MKLAIVLKGYPRLSETFIAQEILALERRGHVIEIWSLRQPTDRYLHPMHQAIAATKHYLPEYLYEAPLRVLRSAWRARGNPRLAQLLATFWRDLKRDFTPNRLRRLGQAFVFADELDPAIRHIHVHFLHTPGSVARYAALLTGRSFSFSAHAKDIWTIPDWEKREKIAAASWGVACTRDGWQELCRVAKPQHRDRLRLVYHGLDLTRFPAPPVRQRRDGSAPEEAVRIITVGRAVAKKGLDDLIAALGDLPAPFFWRLTHIGSGPMLPALKAEAERLGIDGRIDWRGSLPQDKVIAALAESDLFVLPSKAGGDGDRDGLPNVLMEASTQALPLISTDFAGVPEFIRDGHEGLLVPPGDRPALAGALAKLIGDPDLRKRLGQAALQRVQADFSAEAGIARIDGMLRASQNDVD